MQKRPRTRPLVQKADPLPTLPGKKEPQGDSKRARRGDRIEPSVERVYQALVQLYGERKRHPTGHTVLDALVRTILSQNTTDKLSGAAFRALKSRYPVWTDVLTAPIAALEDTIRVGGLARTKAQRIHTILQELERNALVQGKGIDWTQGLEFLRNESTAQVMSYLTQYPGVGPKTAACVAMFTLGRDDVFPVDTHIYRVGKRLGWVPTTRTREQAQEDLESLIPKPLHYPMHLLMIRHGREVCSAQVPRCEACKLADLGCPSAKSNQSFGHSSQRKTVRDASGESMINPKRLGPEKNIQDGTEREET